ncbi:MAG: phosphotransferase [Dehalococcoidia bacterium]|nr:phosphotransferase [Dehalococcoidia bacterium]
MTSDIDTHAGRFRRWTPPDFADLQRVARAIEARCPEAAPAGPLRVLGEGFFSLAVTTASGFVFRLGTSPDVFARYEREWRVLPWLASHRLPARVPAHRWLFEPSADFPFGGIGYPLIEGRTLTQEDADGPMAQALAAQIAAFNLAVHRLPTAEAFALGVPDGRDLNREWHLTDRDVSLHALRGVLTSAELAVIEAWWRGFMAYFEARAYAPVMTHADIGDENLLVDASGTHLVGVLDWEHCAVGDPLDDFRHLQYLGPDFLRLALEAYAGLGGTAFPHVEEDLAWRWQRGAFPSIRRMWQRGEDIEADEMRARLRRHGVLE